MILSTTIIDDIRLDHGVWLAKQARKHRCDQIDIIAAIKPQPSPASQAPAALTPAVAPAVVKAEGAPHAASSATEPQPTSTPAAQAHIVEPVSNQLDERPTSLPGADGAADPATIQPETVSEASPSIEGVNEPLVTVTADANSGGENVAASLEIDTLRDDEIELNDAGKSAEAAASAAPFPPRPITKGEQVRRCHAAHPDWPANKIAAETGVQRSSVTAFASMFGLKLPSQVEYEAAQEGKTTAALKAVVETEPPAPMPTVRKRGLFNLRDRFGEYLHKNMNAMTRREDCYWEGTESDILAIKKAKPKLRDLTERPAK